MLLTSRRRLGRAVVALATTLVVLISPVGALAASGPWESIDLTLIPDGQQAILLVSGTLPNSTKLPAKVDLAVPAGSQIQWAGEILGGDPSADPQVQYTVKKGDVYDLVQFTAVKSRNEQVEVIAPNSLTPKGSANVAAIDWTAPYDIASTSVRVQIPNGAKVQTASQGASPENVGATQYYSLKPVPTKAGQRLQLSVEYTGGTPGGTGSAPGGAPGGTGTPAQPASSTGGSNGLVWLIVVAAIIGGFLFMQQQRIKAAEAELEEDEEYDDEEYDEGDASVDRADDDAEEDYDPFEVDEQK